MVHLPKRDDNILIVADHKIDDNDHIDNTDEDVSNSDDHNIDDDINDDIDDNGNIDGNIDDDIDDDIYDNTIDYEDSCLR